jgi:hypothetical protein
MATAWPLNHEKPSAPGRLRFHQRYLDPVSRLGEILFGAIMVLTITLTAGLTADSGKEGVRELLLAAIGCNIAWGVIDAIMYIMSCVTERGAQARVVLALQNAPDTAAALDIMHSEFDSRLGAITGAEEREDLYRSVIRHMTGGKVPRVTATKDDFLGAVAVFWLVFLSCLPAAIPFLFFSDPLVALRVSNLMMVGMLLAIGFKWGEYAYTNRLLAGVAMAAVGLALVGVAILLGG